MTTGNHVYIQKGNSWIPIANEKALCGGSWRTIHEDSELLLKKKLLKQGPNIFPESYTTITVTIRSRMAGGFHRYSLFYVYNGGYRGGLYPVATCDSIDQSQLVPGQISTLGYTIVNGRIYHDDIEIPLETGEFSNQWTWVVRSFGICGGKLYSLSYSSAKDISERLTGWTSTNGNYAVREGNLYYIATGSISLRQGISDARWCYGSFYERDTGLYYFVPNGNLEVQVSPETGWKVNGRILWKEGKVYKFGYSNSRVSIVDISDGHSDWKLIYYYDDDTVAIR